MKKKSRGRSEDSFNNISSTDNIKVSLTPKQYYNQPYVKDTLLDIAQYKRNNVIYTRASIHDRKGWYSYKGKDENKQRRMFQGNDSKAYDRLISQTDRTLYMTLNHFRDDYKPFKTFQEESWEIDGYDKCYAYILSVDIDLKDGHSVDKTEDKKALQLVTEFTYHKLNELSNGKLICLFSGNGAYIHLNPRFGYIKGDVKPRKRINSYENLETAFNNYLFDIESEFYQLHPEYKDVVSLDRINNRNRQIKVPLSIHKTFNYVVYPIAPGGFEIELIEYQDITPTQVQQVREWYKKFLFDEPNDKQRKQFIKELKPYIDEAKKINKDIKGFKKPQAPENAYDIDLITLEPVLESIFDPEEWEEGSIRRITLMASYLSASGWEDKIIYDWIRAHVKEWKRLPEDLDRRISYGIQMNPPGFDRIYTNYTKFPSVGLLELQHHLPERPREYDYPMQFIHRKYNIQKSKEAIQGKKTFFLEDNVYAYVDDGNKIIQKCTQKFDSEGNLRINHVNVIKAKPKEVNIYESPLEGEPTKFECIWESNSRLKPLKTPPMTTEDMLIFLRESGLILSRYYAPDTLNATLNGYAEYNMAEIKTEIQQPGFYLDDDNNLVAVDYVPEYTREGLTEALQLVRELREEYYNKQGDKFIHVFKWGLISPFIYCMKQDGEVVPWIFLHGKSQSGKSTFGIIVLWVWGVYDRTHAVGGEEISTIARLGHVLEQGTFPTLVNEPKGAMSNDAVMEGIKNSIDTLVCRGRYVGTRYKQSPALAPCMITANTYRPEEEATANRFDNIDFTFSEKKDKHQKEEFNKVFKPKIMTNNAPLSVLESLGGYIATRILEDPELLKQDWKTLSDALLTDAFKECGLDIPEWVTEWTETETIEDIEEEAYSMVIDLLKKEINRAYNIKIQLVDEEGKYINPEDKISEDITIKDKTIIDKALYVISTDSITWLTAKNIKGNDYILISYPFVKLVSNEVGISESMESMAEMLGHSVKPVKIGRKSVKFIGIPKVDFFSMISYEEMGNMQTKFNGVDKEDS